MAEVRPGCRDEFLDQPGTIRRVRVHTLEQRRVLGRIPAWRQPWQVVVVMVELVTQPGVAEVEFLDVAALLGCVQVPDEPGDERAGCRDPAHRGGSCAEQPSQPGCTAAEDQREVSERASELVRPAGGTPIRGRWLAHENPAGELVRIWAALSSGHPVSAA